MYGGDAFYNKQTQKQMRTSYEPIMRAYTVKQGLKLMQF